MRMPPRASGHSSVSIGKVGRWGGGGGGLERTEEPDRHAGNDARLAARLDEADDAAAGGQRGEDVGGEFEALGEGEVSVRPVLSARGVSGLSYHCWGCFGVVWCCWCCCCCDGIDCKEEEMRSQSSVCWWVMMSMFCPFCSWSSRTWGGEGWLLQMTNRAGASRPT